MTKRSSISMYLVYRVCYSGHMPMKFTKDSLKRSGRWMKPMPKQVSKHLCKIISCNKLVYKDGYCVDHLPKL